MLAKRIITGIVGAALTIFIIYEGEWLYFGLVTLLALLGWREYVQLLTKLKANLTVIFGFVWIIALFSAYWFTSVKLIALLCVILLSWVLLRTVLFHSSVKPVDSAYSLYGLLYLGCGFLAMLALRHGQMGTLISGLFSTELIDPSRFIVFLMIFSTWASDTFAFAVGKATGKNKLCPAISPGKTVEGFVGGLIGTILTALIFSVIFKFSLLHALAIGVIISIMAPLGDLVESILKRVCQVKDSGNLIPGHGGILDRFDSLLFTAPAVFVYLLCVAG